MTQTTADRRVTAADIAREVGVSRATVGFVLNSTPGQTISEMTKSKVIAAAQRLGYRPHLAAKALASGRSKIVLLVLPDWPMEYSMSRHIDQASTALDEAGYSLVTMTPHVGGRARPLWETLQPDVVLGMVPFTREQADMIRAAGVTAVIPGPDQPLSDEGFSWGDGPRLQVNHLAEHGRRRLAFAAPTDVRLSEISTGRHRIATAACDALGMDRLDSVRIDAETARDVVSAWRANGVDGVVAYNDEIAAIVVGAALRLGISVPEQLSVVGHDNAPLARLFVPSLSSVFIDDEGLGRHVAQLALSAALGEAPPTGHVPRAQLIPRESTATRTILDSNS